ncbi:MULTISPECIES: excisionase family protein [Enterobacter]|uniref:excisionase family protein n=1 Tax=Enterobacter TaxID=547 RepID=UPI0021CABAF4|nr:excisionase family protein [Enterobacter mori]HDC4609879.1 excisionase family protein [Enterobacter kobei]MCU3988093.1 excisionase family protein [Enterobacter mori]HDC4625512.1 excisionase family protein [Enterobacter kobei]HDR2346419.1 excisionase family protein [Enterobacter kobei]HDR2360823.1 excisionase family protein [Enterobacter kobei]
MRDTTDIIHLVPNDWVSEKVLIAVTGLKPGTIIRARKESWLLGREYLHISPDGNPKPSSECMYNRKAVDQWIEAQKKNQPGAKTA